MGRKCQGGSSKSNLWCDLLYLWWELVGDRTMKIAPFDYGRTNRHWVGDVAITELPRLSDTVELTSTTVHVELTFSRDEQQRTRLHGNAQVQALIPCHLCTKRVAAPISSAIDAFISLDDESGRALAHEADVILISNYEVAVSELIEDDLLLSVPVRLEEGSHRCSFKRRITTKGAEPGEQETHRPMANIRDLLREHES